MILKVNSEEEWNRLEIGYQNGIKVLLRDDILLGCVKKELPLKGAVWIQYEPVPKQMEEDWSHYRKAIMLIAVMELEGITSIIPFVLKPDGKLGLYDRDTSISEAYLHIGEPISYMEWENQVPTKKETDGILIRILTVSCYEAV